MTSVVLVVGLIASFGIAVVAFRMRRATPSPPVQRGALGARSTRTPPGEPAPPRPGADAVAAPVAPPAAHSTMDLRATFENVAQQYKLPPLSTTVTQGMELTRDPEVDIDRLCRALSSDPALVGRILAVARSPLYAVQRPPQTLLDAMTMLGVSTIRRMLMTVGMDMLRVRSAPEFESLWRHNLGTAIAAQWLAVKSRSWTADQAYLAGLLHEVAYLLFLRADRDRFLALWRNVEGDMVRGCQAERETYGRDHAFIGASILYQWRMDEEIVDAVLRHHDGDGGAPLEPHASLLAAADFLASEAGCQFLAPAVRPAQALLDRFGLVTDEDVERTVAELQAAVEYEAKLLS